MFWQTMMLCFGEWKNPVVIRDLIRRHNKYIYMGRYVGSLSKVLEILLFSCQNNIRYNNKTITF